jgi:hypothetical protein
MTPMRTFLFSAAFLLAFVNKNVAQTNVYHPMADSLVSWCESATWGFCPAVDKYVLSIEGDTVINSMQYHKLYASGNVSCQQYQPTFYSHEYRGAFREDSTQKKVYYTDMYGSADELLYDFNLVVGDTIPGAAFTSVITSIDSVLVGSNYRKRFLTNGYFMNGYLNYVEGIGSNMGFYQLIYLAVEYGATMHTYSENNIEVYQHDMYGCSVMLDLTEKPKPLQLEIFPNPSSGTVTIDFGEEITEGKIEIFDMPGNKIVSKTISNQSKFICENLPSGIYIITVTDQDNRTANKKIVRYQ